MTAQEAEAAVEAVARAIANELLSQDYENSPVPDEWGMTLPYLDQGEVDFSKVARAAIAAYEATLRPAVQSLEAELAEVRANVASIDQQVSHGKIGDWSIALTEIRKIARAILRPQPVTPE